MSKKEEQKKVKSFSFNTGDTVKVFIKIKEGGKERLQRFQGTVIRKHGKGKNKTFTVRKVTQGIGIEKIFPLYSPNLEKVDVIKKGKTRRARLNYLRKKKGKKAKIKEAT